MVREETKPSVVSQCRDGQVVVESVCHGSYSVRDSEHAASYGSFVQSRVIWDGMHMVSQGSSNQKARSRVHRK